MGAFQTIKYIPCTVSDLAPVANDLMQHFRDSQYEVTGQQTPTGGWHISISKGGIFKAVLGMKTALNVEIEPSGGGVTAKAGVGIFGMQAIPAAIALFVTWPVLLTQLWGIVHQMQLDDEAIECVEESIKIRSAGASSQGTEALDKFCPGCGTRVMNNSRFCPACGTKIQ